MYKLLFIVITLFLIGYTIANCKVTEGFADTTVPITSANIDEYVYKVYKADVKAIQNLADIAMKLQAGGVTVPGTMTISNQLNVTNATLLSNTLEVKGNITGPTITDLYKQITDLQARCATLEGKLNNIFNGNVNIKGSLTIEGNVAATRLDANSTIPGGNGKYIFNIWGGPSVNEGWGNRILVYPDTLEPNKFYNLFTTRYWQPNVGAANCEGPSKYGC